MGSGDRLTAEFYRDVLRDGEVSNIEDALFYLKYIYQTEDLPEKVALVDQAQAIVEEANNVRNNMISRLLKDQTGEFFAILADSFDNNDYTEII